ncbi:MAG: hypothetical protein ACXAC8_03520 [Candidatus Hodarchaeales archaeon]|jgi:Fe-S-cluster containining protein
MIRGFSRFTGYSCSDCQFKCCASEYDLPLSPIESKTLLRNYSFSSFFIQEKDSKEFIIRGESCPFLQSKGLCLLHNTNNKPLICQTFPLIFWKISHSSILSWISPCRGNGFRWVADSENRISDHFLQRMLNKVQKNFTFYWGEQIDHNNPFSEISEERFREELQFFEKSNQNDLLSLLIELNDQKHYPNLLEPLIDRLKINSNEREMKLYNAVLHWLCWSPVGLKLTFKNSKLIFLIATMWIDYNMTTPPLSSYQPLKRDHFLQQIGSFLANAILPSFWKHVEKKTTSDILRKFSKQVQGILTGKLPQQIFEKSF